MARRVAKVAKVGNGLTVCEILRLGILIYVCIYQRSIIEIKPDVSLG